MSESKVSITLSHRAPGIQPPVYVAGSFSDPQWVPVPMDYTTGEDGVHTFTKTLEVAPKSKIAYKYRVGDGDWWMLNEDAPTITDDAGNRNNFLEAPETHETTKAPAAKPEDKQIPDVAAVEPTESSTKEQSNTATEGTYDVTNDDTQETRPVPMVEALKQPEHIDRWNTHTPEVAAEVADSAALLDLPTPEPEASDELVGETEAEPPSAIADIAEKAAEADIAAEVADTAETLDRDEPETQLKTEPSSVAPAQDSADVAAEVADTAEALDADEPKIHLETAPSAYRTLADVKADMKDDSLDIAGYSNDPEPVPLFAHECAGLYEDDEIPGAADVDKSDTRNASPHKHHEDFEDPTLEKFPSNKDEIISAVRKVETGLNADQTSVEGVPPSPLFKARHSSVADASSDHSEPSSPTSARGPQNLSLPPSLPQQSLSECSLSATSLHSIAESVEGEDAEKIKSEETENTTAKDPGPAETAEEVAKVVQDAHGGQANEVTAATEGVPTVEVSDVAEDAPIHVAEDSQPTTEQTASANGSSQPRKEADGQGVQESKAEEIAPLVEKAETADEAIQVAKEAEGEANLNPQKPALASLITVPSPSTKATTGLLSPVSDEDEAVVLKNGKGKVESTESPRPGYLTPERAATPKPEEPGSPREPPPNAADPFSQNDLEDLAPAAPRSPQIVVSKAEETQPHEDLLLAPSFAEDGGNESEMIKDDEAPRATSNPKDAEGNKSPVAVEEVQTTPSVSRLQETSSHTETAATSAFEDSQAGSLKKRSVAKPNPADRTGTPTSITETHREAAKGGNWFSAFFRLIFIDLVGGFVSRLCGGRRKTLVTTVVVLSAVGLAMFRKVGEART